MPPSYYIWLSYKNLLVFSKSARGHTYMGLDYNIAQCHVNMVIYAMIMH